MDLDFTKEQEILRKSIAHFLAKECPFEQVKEIEDSSSGYSVKIWKDMANLGWMELPFPEKYGGLGSPFIDLIIVMEEMGKKAFPSPFFSTVLQCGLIILENGSEKQKEEILPKIADGSLIMSLAQMEEEGSYKKTGINMQAQQNGETFVLNGTKLFVMDANIAERLIVAVYLPERGITLFLIDADMEGISCSKMQTVGKDNNCVVSFKDVKTTENDMIGNPGEGWTILEKMAEKATVAKCAEMLGGCRESIDMTVAYAKQRQQYGHPIGGYQAIQHYLANMKVAYDTGLYYLYKVAWMLDNNMDATREISSLKAHVNEQYKFITDRAVQIHGGVGTTREFNIGLFYRRAKACEYIMGDTDYHFEKIADILEM